MEICTWQNRNLILNTVMHETLSEKFIGNLDTVEVINGSLKITGWIVDRNFSGTAEKDIAAHLSNSGSVLEAGVFLKERIDVLNHYNNSNRVYLNSGFEIMLPLQTEDIDIVVKGAKVFSIPGKRFAYQDLDSVIQLNSNAKPELIVVDNFYKDPDAVRAYALEQEFKANELYHKGSRTQKSYIPSWVKGEFSRLLNKQVTEFVGATGVFQYCVAKDNVVFHYDTQEYAGMVYLTPNAPLQTGTQTFRSIHTGLFGAATDEDALRLGRSKETLDYLSFNGNNFYDRHNMELVDSVANVYNRLVIFNARSLHAATSYFGDTKENARLFHLYFFNC